MADNYGKYNNYEDYRLSYYYQKPPIPVKDQKEVAVIQEPEKEQKTNNSLQVSSKQNKESVFASIPIKDGKGNNQVLMLSKTGKSENSIDI